MHTCSVGRILTESTRTSLVLFSNFSPPLHDSVELRRSGAEKHLIGSSICGYIHLRVCQMIAHGNRQRKETIFFGTFARSTKIMHCFFLGDIYSSSRGAIFNVVLLLPWSGFRCTTRSQRSPYIAHTCRHPGKILARWFRGRISLHALNLTQ